MISNATNRKFHAMLLRRKVRSFHEFFLNADDFHDCAQCERMRVDRNGSVLSLLLLRFSSAWLGTSSMNRFAAFLEQRLRVTDTAGIVRDGRIGLLLPDTPEAGAWKVASDLSEFFPPGPARPECEVLIYPDGMDPMSDAEIADRGEPTSSSNVERQDGGEFFCQTMPAWKRILDVTGAFVGLTLSSPLVLAGSIAIKATSPGPVIFSQEREGKGGQRFRIYKLRTMHRNAEALKDQLREHSCQDGPAFKMRRDPRTTRVGRLLRWLSIDELPQFWNVLRGDMSLVGPRPLPTEESLACQGWHRRRLTVSPGMTGMWQVFGRGRVGFDEWVRMDLRYVRRQSLARDVALIVATLPALIFHKGMR